jgi:hypothetical protein
VPPAPTGEILHRARRLRRRRAASVVAAAALTVAVVAVGAAVLRDDSPTTVAPASTPPASFAWAVDDTVYVGPEGSPVRMPEVAQTLYYTSAGVLVRTNLDGTSNGGAPFHFELVDPHGTATKLGVTLGDVVPATDPSQPYLAWATMEQGHIQVVVHDVVTDRDVATVDVPGSFTWGGWNAPPVSMSGDQVYVATDLQAQVVDWRTGETHPSTVVPGSTYPTVAGGHVLSWRPDHVDVLDAETGKVLLRVDGSVNDAQLSPDGRLAAVSRGGQDELYDLAGGTTSRISLSSWGWAPDSDEVFGVHGSTLTTCSTTSGACQDTRVPPVGKDASVRYAGHAYES